jgi:mono/diheme cytochrome c family protein
LTPDPTTGLALTEAEFVTALQTGRDYHVTTSDEQLLVMPWLIFRWMESSDLKAIYAYLKQIPAVMNQVPADNKGALKFPSYPKPAQYDAGDQTRPLPPEDGTDPDRVALGRAIQPLAEPASYASLSATDQKRFGRGSYIANAVGQCNDCHTNPPNNPFPPQPPFTINTAAYLTGGTVFRVPPPLQPMIHQTRTMSENLAGQTNGFIATADQATFELTITTGLHQDRAGNPPLGFPMPADAFKNMTPEDLVSVFTYLKNLTPRTGAADVRRQVVARWCDASNPCMGAGETCHMDAMLGNECIGGACSTDADCGACQTCATGTCQAPSPTSACIMTAF